MGGVLLQQLEAIVFCHVKERHQLSACNFFSRVLDGLIAAQHSCSVFYLVALWHRCVQVRLRPDERYGAVRFGTTEAVQSAIDALHGTKICGEKISVTRGDLLAAVHSNSKRPRMAPSQPDHMLSRAF